MAQPIIPPDTKVPPSSVFTAAAPPPNSLPPSYPSTFPPYPQPQDPTVQPSVTGQPLRQPSYVGLHTQPIPQVPGAQPPLGTMSPQNTGQLPGQLPGQQAPLGMSPIQPQVPMGTFPQQPSPGVNPLLNHQASMMNLQLMQAQLGAQYQATQFGQCAMGNHARQTKYGVLGIIGAILFFPIGLLCLFADRKDVCLRCGQRL